MNHGLDNVYELQRVGSITAVDRAEWNAITDGDVTAHYGWLKVAEEYGLAGRATEYILLRDRERLVGAVVCQTECGAGQVKDIDAYLFGRFKKHASALGVSFMPTLFGGARRGCGTHVLVAPSMASEERLTVMRRLIKATEARAWELNMGLCFDGVTAEETLLIQVLEERAYGRTIDQPAAVMDIEWNSMEGYLRHLRRTRGSNKTVRHEIQRNRKAGVNIYALESVGDQEDRMHQLLVDNREKYGGQGLGFRLGFLSRAKAELRDNALIYAAEKEGQLIGVCLVLIGKDSGYVLHVGVDHEVAGNDFTYFNITYYRPANDAPAMGVTQLRFGTLHYELKVRRGCRIMPTFMYCKSPSWIGNAAARPFLKVHSAWYRRKLPQVARGEGIPV